MEPSVNLWKLYTALHSGSNVKKLGNYFFPLNEAMAQFIEEEKHVTFHLSVLQIRIRTHVVRICKTDVLYSIQCTFVTFAFPLPGELVDECILLTVLHPEVPAHQHEPQGPWGGSGSHISVGFGSEAGSRSRMLTSFNFIAWVNQKILIQNWMFPLLYCLIIVHVYMSTNYSSTCTGRF